MPVTYLEAHKVPAHLQKLNGYNGKRFAVIVTESVTIPIDAGLWDGGSRDVYFGVKLATGETASDPMQSASPFGNVRKERSVALASGFAMVRHTLFQGKDLGLTFYLHPSDVAQMLPASEGPELTGDEKLALNITKRYVSRARLSEFSYEVKLYGKAAEMRWNAAIEGLKAKGLLARNGSITVTGKNLAGGA